MVRSQELEDALRPENIERALAGVGSTKPEELREQLGRRLTIEKSGVMAQLKLLEASRANLEANPLPERQVLNAFRHHRNSHEMTAEMVNIEELSAQRLSASSEFSQALQV